MRYSFFAIAALSLAGCAQRPPPVNAISVPVISKVLAEIKREVSIYQALANGWRTDPQQDPAGVANLHFVCGSGKVDFDIISINAELTTTNDNTASGSLGLTIPIVGPTGSIGPKGGGSREVSNTQRMEFTLYPIDDPTFRITAPDNKSAPIAEALRDLRTALIRDAAAGGACMYDYNHADPKSDKGHSYTLGLTVTDDANGGIDIKLAIISLSVSGETKSVTGNTLTVTFQQRGIARGDSKAGQPGVTGRPRVGRSDSDIGKVAPGPRRPQS